MAHDRRAFFRGALAAAFAPLLRWLPKAKPESPKIATIGTPWKSPDPYDDVHVPEVYHAKASEDAVIVEEIWMDNAVFFFVGDKLIGQRPCYGPPWSPHDFVGLTPRYSKLPGG